MAPDLALGVLHELPDDSVVLDPMCGSGTVLRYASDLGHRAIGVDLDPLSILMARVWNRRVRRARVLERANDLLDDATHRQARRVALPWIDDDPRTSEFVDYWFGATQQAQLRPLAAVLHEKRGATWDVLRLALSRTIVTKEQGASLARDTSHSRPHRVSLQSDYDVFGGFRRALIRILDALDNAPPQGRVSVRRSDARRLSGIRDATVDCVLTSPPYLNAIDYLRGHRMALVWLGHGFGELSGIRSRSVGAERALHGPCDPLVARARKLAWRETLSSRHQGILDRYVHDMALSAREARRVLKPGGRAVLVVGNSTLKGTFVQTSDIVRMAYEANGMRLTMQREREIPANRRYLPPPVSTDSSSLAQRMRVEVVLNLQG